MKKSTKLMISLGSIASVISLPLIAASCGGTKKEDPKPNNPELKEVQDSLNNVTVSVTDKNKLPNAVQVADVTIGGKVDGFTYVVEGLTPNNTTGELTIRVKSSKGQVSATRDLKISGFTRENSQNGDNQGDNGQKPSPTPETEQEKLAKKITFGYNGTINETVTDFDNTKITLGKNDGFNIDRSKTVLRKNTGLSNSIFPTRQTFAIAKLTLTKENKIFDFYVKFQTKQNNPVGIQVLKTEFDDGEDIKISVPANENEFKSQAEFVYNGNLRNKFDETKLRLVENFGFAYKILEKETGTFSTGDKYLVLKIRISKTEINEFDVYVRFTKEKGDFVDKLVFDNLKRATVKAEIENKIKYEGTLVVKDFSLDKVKGEQLPAGTTIEAKEVQKNDSKAIVKVLATKNSETFTYYVKFELESAKTKITFTTQNEFDTLAKQQKEATVKAEIENKIKYEGTLVIKDFSLDKVKGEQLPAGTTIEAKEVQKNDSKAIVKVLATKNSETFTYYVKFELESAKTKITFTTQNEFDTLAKQQKEATVKAEIENKIKYEGTLVIKDFSLDKVKGEQLPAGTTIEAKEVQKNDSKAIVKVLATKNSETFTYYVKFELESAKTKITFTTQNEFDTLAKQQKEATVKAEIENKIKYEGTLVIKDFSLDKVKGEQLPAGTTIEAKEVQKNDSKAIVKVLATKNSETFTYYVKFELESAKTKITFTTQNEFDTLAKQQKEATVKAEIENKIKYEGTLVIKDFSLDKVKGEQLPAGTTIEAKEVQKNDSKAIVKVLATKNSETFTYYVKFELESAKTKITFTTQNEFDTLNVKM
ncbi:variable surface lipoprotein [Mycoplasma phocoeninasale]|uniref:variable surface lipoprotein n=1 Tax=Mycoplasma phocoeninasale TaxID=2726117 RepID=UPI00146EA509|nr:variable surface lipoprotein [Mycoplasma phocoeninasale]